MITSAVVSMRFISRTKDCSFQSVSFVSARHSGWSFNIICSNSCEADILTAVFNPFIWHSRAKCNTYSLPLRPKYLSQQQYLLGSFITKIPLNPRNVDLERVQPITQFVCCSLKSSWATFWRIPSQLSLHKTIDLCLTNTTPAC